MADEALAAWEALQTEIETRSELELKDLPRMEAYLWVARRTPLEVQMVSSLLASSNKPVPYEQLLEDLTPMVVRRYGPWPNDDSYAVAELFEDEAEVVVYAIAAKDKNTRGVRYKITKANPLPVYTVEAMTFDTWMDELVAQWEEVDGATNPAEVATEEERESVLSYARSLPADYAIANLISDLEDENHLVEVEEEGEDEDDEADGETPAAAAESKAPAPAAAPSATSRTTEEAAPPATA